MSKGRVMAVIGGQYGSEGKGVVVNHLASKFEVHVRSGGPNAGHSLSYNGKVYKMQQIPCGWTNKVAQLVLSRGALIDIDQLLFELYMISEFDSSIWDRVRIDAKAHVIDERHRQMSAVAGRTDRIGSTGEGVGSARVSRILRDPAIIDTFERAILHHPHGAELDGLVDQDTRQFLSISNGLGAPILLEGTQGHGLSVIHGEWPYCTSHDTTAATLAADAGIPPHHITDILMVVRTYPIRVAGNSGPMHAEIDWEELSERLGREVVEHTTVTKKVRRVGLWDHKLVSQAVMVNRPTAFALMFADYLNPADEGVTQFHDLSDNTHAFVNYLESSFKTPVALIGTGGEGWKVVDRGIL